MSRGPDLARGSAFRCAGTICVPAHSSSSCRHHRTSSCRQVLTLSRQLAHSAAFSIAATYRFRRLYSQLKTHSLKLRWPPRQRLTSNLLIEIAPAPDLDKPRAFSCRGTSDKDLALRRQTTSESDRACGGRRKQQRRAPNSTNSKLVLSILGLLSSRGDAERQCQRERALRIALGTQRWRIVLLVVKNAGGLALFGTAIGTSLSYALLRVMIAGITVVTSPPFLVWLIAPLLPAAAIIIASMLPARRASVVSPATIMREN